MTIIYGSKNNKNYKNLAFNEDILTNKRDLLKNTKKAVKTAFNAVWTGLEPATPCVTGRYSNQLNYQTKKCKYILI